jgi:hypothetical protein
VHAAEEPPPSALVPEVEAITDKSLLTWSLLHSGQVTGFGCAVKKTSLSNLAPHVPHSYS